MASIVDMVDKLHSINWNIFKNKNSKDKTLSFLQKYKQHRILILGYDKECEYDTLIDIDSDKLHESMEKYDIIVFSEKYCYLSRQEIQNIQDIISNSKKVFIFLGYSSIINLNIDNHKKMFRPIDPSKYPFKCARSPKILKKGLSSYFTITYVVFLIFSIIVNIKEDYLLYRINLIIMLLIILIIPYKKYLVYH